jgi:hypothetical protein
MSSGLSPQTTYIADPLTQLHPQSLSLHLISFDFFHMADGQYLFQKVKSAEQTGGVEIGFIYGRIMAAVDI